MGQIAHRPATGETIEAFSASDAEWVAILAAPKGALLMPRTHWPAVAKTSPRGLRFFAHHPGYPERLPAPESYAHARLKIDVVRALRSLGYRADVEVQGRTPEGELWIADVLAETPTGGRVAFEIQLSSQHLDDFRARTRQYAKSGVRVCWLMSEEPVGLRLTKALWQETRGLGRLISDCEEIVPFSLRLEGKDTYPDAPPELRFARGSDIKWMPLAEAVAGMIAGRPKWTGEGWAWGEPTIP